MRFKVLVQVPKINKFGNIVRQKKTWVKVTASDELKAAELAVKMVKEEHKGKVNLPQVLYVHKTFEQISIRQLVNQI